MNRRTALKTEDGTSSFIDNIIGETFHSQYGAITESRHIFIQSGLEFLKPKYSVNILEIGWGTGLNSFLALEWQKQNKINMNYFAIEKFPLKMEEAKELNYSSFITEVSHEEIMKFHSQSWDISLEVIPGFFLHKSSQDIANLKLEKNYFDIVFFDAFSPDKQPELWTEQVFKTIFTSMKNGSVLTTYSVKGDVRRAMKSAGFLVEKILGPVGKREISRAIKS